MGRVSVIEARGRLGASAVFDGQVVVVRRSGAVTGSGELAIPIGQIASIEFKPARLLVDGYIRFVPAGTAKPRARLGRRVEDARFDEYAVPFWKKAQPQFETLRDAVQNAIRQPNGGQPTSPPDDPATALNRLEQLRVQGLITLAEYQAKRADILGRM